jgi:hypothetical protein
MSNFLEGYEDAAARVLRFQGLHPVGRIETEVINHNPVQGLILVKASIYREHEDILAAGVDYAYGEKDTYPMNMRKWYVEDTVTSAISRAIALVIPTEKKPTSENMARVDKPTTAKPFAEKLQDRITVPVADDPWTIKAVDPSAPAVEAVQLVKDVLGGKTQEDIPTCKHGEMVWKTGVSQKNKKPWGQFRCKLQASAGAVQEAFCDPVWYEISKEDGSWKPQVKW